MPTAPQEGRQRLLMILPMLPYPLRANGLSVRYWPVLQHLARRFAIDLIAISRTVPTPDVIHALRSVCRHVSVIPRHTLDSESLSDAVLRRTAALFPWTLPRTHRSPVAASLASQLRTLTCGHDYAVLVWVVGTDTSYGIHVPSARRRVVDFMDSPSLVFDRYLGGAWISPVFRRYESWKTRRWEASVIRAADETLYVSPVDAKAVPAKMTLGYPRRVIANPLMADSYSPLVERSVRTPSIGFHGDMSYRPNVDAAHWLVANVFLPCRALVPSLHVYLIGRNPAPTVVKLSEEVPGVIVTGSVEDIWRHLNALDVFICPLQTGAGLKNKILEAMCARRPVVTTPLANEGIDAVHGRDLLLCATPAEFQQATLSLLERPDERQLLGERAHRFVTHTFNPTRIFAEFDRAVDGETDGPPPSQESTARQSRLETP